MRFYFIVFFMYVTVVKAQTYEAGVMLGGVNALSDIGSQKHLNPTDLGFGLVFKWNKSQRYAWRAGLSYANLSFDDKKAQASAIRSVRLCAHSCASGKSSETPPPPCA